ncbi:MAG: dephospho-CoA kinase [Actinomycetota bacterium]|nr:dephospho-CoA kinase [Actinomycetota bacterium]
MKASKFSSILTYRSPVLGWMGLIFYLSSRPISFPIHPLLSNTFHFVEYAILTFLLLIAFKNTTNLQSTLLCAWAMSISIGYGILDEIHQIFVPTRIFSLWDVAVDSLAALIVAFMAREFLRREIPKMRCSKIDVNPLNLVMKGRKSMKVIGVTGGIATGKSTVAKLLASRGAKVIDADQISREVMAPKSEVWEKIVTYFGEEILLQDGSIDRKKLAKIVFSDPQELEVLNRLTHPSIIKVIEDRLEELKRTRWDQVIVFDCPLLIETQLLPLVDEVVVVTTKEETQIKRLEEKGLSAEEARARMRAQIPQEERVKFADYIVENDGTLDELREKVDELWEAIKADQKS